MLSLFIFCMFHSPVLDAFDLDWTSLMRFDDDTINDSHPSHLEAQIPTDSRVAKELSTAMIDYIIASSLSLPPRTDTSPKLKTIYEIKPPALKRFELGNNDYPRDGVNEKRPFEGNSKLKEHIKHITRKEILPPPLKRMPKNPKHTPGELETKDKLPYRKILF
ncbi:hypothetical protein AB6A40_001028 [Gnathostoma spinigerum]|uniref:Uncharacterized protein n=1 Tax=Gnathostoma spinigerum TaxID=75299 RepID=A0ABD6E827_9BILA